MISIFQQDMAYTVLNDANMQSLIGDRFYPLEAPQGSPYPYAIYTGIVLLDDYRLDGPSGLVEQRIQYDAYAQDTPSAGGKDLALRVIEGIIALFRGQRQNIGPAGRTLQQHGLVDNIREDSDKRGQKSSSIWQQSIDITFFYTEQ